MSTQPPQAPQQQWGWGPQPQQWVAPGQQWTSPAYQQPPPPKKKRHVVRWIVLSVIGIFVIAGIASAASNSNKISNKPLNNGASPSTASTAGSASPASVTSPKLAHVGSAIAVSDDKGNKGNVTLTQVMDPAQGANEFATPDNGKRFVGVKLVIAGTSGTLSDDANSDASVIGSDNQTYNFDLNDIAGCTNFDNGEFTVATGSTSTGCVVFQLPTGVSVSKVRFDINGGFGNNIAEWLVP